MLNKYSRTLWLLMLTGVTAVSDAAPTTALPASTPASDITRSAPIDKPAPPAPLHENSGNTLNLARLERIQADTLLFEAQVARAKALLSLQQNNGYDASLPAPLSQSLVVPASGGVPGTTLPALPTQVVLPRVVEIAGSGKHLRTRLALADGTAVELSTGQRVPGTNNTVKNITAQEVQVTTSAGETHTLAFTE